MKIQTRTIFPTPLLDCFAPVGARKDDTLIVASDVQNQVAPAELPGMRIKS